jgi:hypothetical protein
MRTRTLALLLALALPLALAGCRGSGPLPPPRTSPVMTEAPFLLGARRDATAADVVMGFPDRADLLATWQLRHLDGDRLVDLPGASAGMLDTFRVLAIDRIVLQIGSDVARYDGTTTTTVPMTGAPPYESRGALASDTRSATGETFVVMAGSFAEGTVFCRGVDTLACAPLEGVAPPDLVELIATDGHVYVYADSFGQAPSVYDVDESGVAREVLSISAALSRAGHDRLLVRSGAGTLVLGDDGAMEELGTGHFEAVGPQGELLRLDLSQDFEGHTCPSGVSCPHVGDANGYTQYVLFRRDGALWVEHAHVDVIDEASGEGQLTLLADRRVALTTGTVAHTFLAPALP